MLVHPQDQERRSSTRIPVDSMLLYRAVGMNNFKPCTALTVSTQALEMVCDRSIPVDTIVTIAVKSDESPKQFYRVYGKVVKLKQREGGWIHVVMASSERPWSSMFLYDVMCSAYKSAGDEITIAEAEALAKE